MVGAEAAALSLVAAHAAAGAGQVSARVLPDAAAKGERSIAAAGKGEAAETVRPDQPASLRPWQSTIGLDKA